MNGLTDERHRPVYVDRMDNDFTFWPGGEVCVRCGESWPCSNEEVLAPETQEG